MAIQSADISVSVGSGQLTVDRVGVAYGDRCYKIVIPWHGISKNGAASVTAGGFLKLTLRSDQPGMSYLVEKAKYSTDDLYDECPIQTDGAELIVNGQLGGDVEGIARLIAVRRREYAETVESLLPGRSQAAVGAVTAVDFRSCSATVDTRCLVQYPPFCPVTGDAASEVLLCTSVDGSATLPLLVTEGAAKRAQRTQKACNGSAVAAVAIYTFLGAWMLLFGESSQQAGGAAAFYSLPIFSVIPFAFWMTRPKVHVTRITDARVRVRFDDVDYFHAFVGLNDTCSTIRS